MNTYSAIIGRIAISIVFIIEGLLKVMDFEAFRLRLEIEHGVPAAPAVAILMILIELGGGISLILGFSARFFSFIMALYLLVATIVHYPFWSDFSLFEEFIRNFAIIGGLLMINSHGAGPSSVDSSHVFDT